MNTVLITLLAAATVASAQYTGTGSVTRGAATTTVPTLYSCPGGRPTALGVITSGDGATWTVPADVRYLNADVPFASDLYDQCTGALYRTASEALSHLDGSDIVVIDADGELITGFFFADNYFELAVNGQLIAKDRVPFTPFNSSIVRVRVRRPFTIAMLLVDWEEHLGLGSESNNGVAYHPGDGGMVAVFRDERDSVVAITNSEWRAQTFYTAPIKDLSCPTEQGTRRLSDACSITGTNDGSAYYAIHWPLPEGWMRADFDDSDWPFASTYTNAQIGVDNKPAYTNFTDVFDAPSHDAQFIWSTNVVLDNAVIVRHTVPAPTSVHEDLGLQHIMTTRIYTILGEYVREDATYAAALESLPAGVYMIVTSDVRGLIRSVIVMK